jgi:N-acetylneuraminic acid mutarotase
MDAKSRFRGTARIGGVGFSIGTKGYIGTGLDRNVGYTNDFWEYDPTVNTWMRKANFGGTARYDAVGFSIDGKGYIGTGPFAKDFWEYDPANQYLDTKSRYQDSWI